MPAVMLNWSVIGTVVWKNADQDSVLCSEPAPRKASPSRAGSNIPMAAVVRKPVK
jgi:hypothetical protein